MHTIIVSFGILRYGIVVNLTFEYNSLTSVKHCVVWLCQGLQAKAGFMLYCTPSIVALCIQNDDNRIAFAAA